MALTQTDKSEIERVIRKELKDFLKDNSFNNKITDVIKKELKSDAHDARVAKISAAVLENLYKILWSKKSFWANEIKNVRV